MSLDCPLTPIGSTKRGPDREWAITKLAERQHGVITLAQLCALGLSDGAVRSRAAAGRLRRIHRGVYAVRGPLSDRGRLLAAVFAGGDGAVASHRSAAHLHGLVPNASARVHITNETGSGWRRPLHVHRSSLPPDEVTVVDSIPVTSVARTLLDLAAVTADAGTLRRAVDRAEALRVFDLAVVETTLRASPGRRGHARMRAVLGMGTVETVNGLEDAMSRICEAARLPRPLVNHWIPFSDGSGVRPDFLGPAQRIAVETDGFAAHGTRRAFGVDRARDRRLKLETGIETYRFTYDEVMHRRSAVSRELVGLLRV